MSARKITTGKTELLILNVLSRAKKWLIATEITGRGNIVEKKRKEKDILNRDHSYGPLLQMLSEKLVKRRKPQRKNKRLDWEWAITPKGKKELEKLRKMK